MGLWGKWQEQEYDTWMRYKEDRDRGQTIFSQCKIQVHVDVKCQPFNRGCLFWRSHFCREVNMIESGSIWK